MNILSDINNNLLYRSVLLEELGRDIKQKQNIVDPGTTTCVLNLLWPVNKIYFLM